MVRTSLVPEGRGYVCGHNAGRRVQMTRETCSHSFASQMNDSISKLFLSFYIGRVLSWPTFLFQSSSSFSLFLYSECPWKTKFVSSKFSTILLSWALQPHFLFHLSTEISLAWLNETLYMAKFNGQLPSLDLTHPSAAFDIINNSIPPETPSWGHHIL